MSLDVRLCQNSWTQSIYKSIFFMTLLVYYITHIHCSMVARLYALLLLSHLLLIIKPRRIISNYVIITKQKMRPKVAKTVHVL